MPDLNTKTRLRVSQAGLLESGIDSPQDGTTGAPPGQPGDASIYGDSRRSQ
jgi:hypothetical protein